MHVSLFRIRRQIVIAGLLLFGAAVAGCGKSATWKTVEGDDQSFTVEMPGEPARSVETLWRGAVQQTLRVTSGKVQYTVECTRYREHDGQEVTLNWRLAAIDQEMHSRTYLSDEKETSGGIYTRRVKFAYFSEQALGDAVMRLVLVMDRDRLYVVRAAVSVKDEPQEAPNIERFLKSFVRKSAAATATATP
jgi:hypothetical protein